MSDSFEITFRSGPSLGHTILRSLTSGAALEVLEAREGWSRVRLLGVQDEQPKGSVLSRYLIERPPWRARAEALEQENRGLQEKLGRLRTDWRDLTGREQRLAAELVEKSEKLAQVEKDYASLKRDSAEFLKLKQDYESDRIQLETSQQRTQELEKENESLRASQRTRWFLAGGLVLLCGLMIGLVAGRQQRKRKPLYY